MKKKFFYKILIVIPFLLIVTMTALLFSKIEQNTITIEPVIYAVCIVFAGLFLMLFLFKMLISGTKTNKKMERKSEKEYNNKAKDKRIEDKRRQQINIIKASSEQILYNIKSADNTKKFSEILLDNLAKELLIVQGIVFIKNLISKKFVQISTYAYYSDKNIIEFELGESISGQVAKNKKLLNITDVPKNYITVLSGLGKGSPSNLLIFPIVYKDETIGIVEISAFTNFPSNINEILKITDNKLSEKLYELLTN